MVGFSNFEGFLRFLGEEGRRFETPIYWGYFSEFWGRKKRRGSRVLENSSYFLIFVRNTKRVIQSKIVGVFWFNLCFSISKIRKQKKRKKYLVQLFFDFRLSSSNFGFPIFDFVVQIWRSIEPKSSSPFEVQARDSLSISNCCTHSILICCWISSLVHSKLNLSKSFSSGLSLFLLLLSWRASKYDESLG